MAQPQIAQELNLASATSLDSSLVTFLKVETEQTMNSSDRRFHRAALASLAANRFRNFSTIFRHFYFRRSV